MLDEYTENGWGYLYYFFISAKGGYGKSHCLYYQSRPEACIPSIKRTFLDFLGLIAQPQWWGVVEICLGDYRLVPALLRKSFRAWLTTSTVSSWAFALTKRPASLLLMPCWRLWWAVCFSQPCQAKDRVATKATIGSAMWVMIFFNDQGCFTGHLWDTGLQAKLVLESWIDKTSSVLLVPSLGFATRSKVFATSRQYDGI